MDETIMLRTTAERLLERLTPVEATGALADFIFERKPARLCLEDRIFTRDEEDQFLYDGPGGAQDLTVLSAMAVGLAAWGRLPTGDEIEELAL